MLLSNAKKQVTSWGSVVRWDTKTTPEFENTFEGSRDPGPVATNVRLRKVKPAGFNHTELQISVEITQRYRSGANSRHMNGSLTLRGEALDDFVTAATTLQGHKPAPVIVSEQMLDVLRGSLAAHERCLPQLRGVLPVQDAERAISELRELIATLEGSPNGTR